MRQSAGDPEQSRVFISGRNPNAVDKVYTDRQGNWVLEVFFGVPWSDGDHEVDYLQRKISFYHVFVTEGHLVQKFPDAAARKVEIVVYSASVPTPRVAAELESLRKRLSADNLTLRVRLIPDVMREHELMKERREL